MAQAINPTVNKIEEHNTKIQFPRTPHDTVFKDTIRHCVLQTISKTKLTVNFLNFLSHNTAHTERYSNEKNGVCHNTAHTERYRSEMRDVCHTTAHTERYSSEMRDVCHNTAHA